MVKAAMKHTVEKGETLSGIGQRYRIHWMRIWEFKDNKDKKEERGKPELIQEGDVLVIPDRMPLAAVGIPKGQSVIKVLRRPEVRGDTPRFDCHVHLHSQSIYRMLLGCFGIESEAQQALLCRAEGENFAAAAGTDKALVPLLLDLCFCPLWRSVSLESSIQTDKIAGLLGSREVGRVTKRDSATSYDPLNIYGPGRYFTVDDGIDRWCETASELAQSRPGRCFPFVPFDPRRTDALTIVQQCILERGFCGIKLYTRNGWRLAQNVDLVGDDTIGAELDRRVAAMFRWAEENDVPVVNHYSPGGWPPEEHLSLPKSFRSSSLQLDIERFVSDWEQEHAWNEIVEYGISIRHRPQLTEICGLLRRLVIGSMHDDVSTHGRKYDEAISTALKKQVPKPAEMLETDYTTWLNFGRDYGVAFSEDISRYKQLTVEPVPEKFGGKYCLAHSGGEGVFLTNRELMGSLSKESQEEIKSYVNRHRSGEWLSFSNIVKHLKGNDGWFVDISYFSGLKVAADQLAVYTYLLKSLAEEGLEDRVLFGTDWPLTWANNKITVNETWAIVESASESEVITSIWPNCWNDITRINPLQYLGLKPAAPQIERIQEFLGQSKWERTWMHAQGLSSSKALYRFEQALSCRFRITIDGKPPGRELQGELRIFEPDARSAHLAIPMFTQKFSVRPDGSAYTDQNQLVPVPEFVLFSAGGHLGSISLTEESQDIVAKIESGVTICRDTRRNTSAELDSGNLILVSRNGAHESTVNFVERNYLNCGSWTATKTEFAAVMGGELFVGSWSSQPNARKPSQPEIDASPLLRRLLCNADSDRLFLIEHKASLQEFSPLDQLWVFIGDCHIHGLAGWLCDNHTRCLDQCPDPELVTFTDHLKTNVKPHRVVQIGDLYEVWEVQALVELAYYVIEDLHLGYPVKDEEKYTREFKEFSMRLNGPELPPTRPSRHGFVDRERDLAAHFAWMLEKFPAEFLSDQDRWGQTDADDDKPVWETNRRRVLEYFGLNNSSMERHRTASHWLKNVTLPDVMALMKFRYQLDFSGYPGLHESWSTPKLWLAPEAVKEAIRQGNPDLRDFWQSLDQDSTWSSIDGNHDTSTINRHLEIVFSPQSTGKRQRALRRLSREQVAYENDPTASLDVPKLSHSTTNGKVIYEHGDACDFFNNWLDFAKMAFDRISGGYFGTRGRVLDELKERRAIMAIQDFVADKSLVRAAKRRARRIFERHSEVRLVVLGHTHEPLLVDADLEFGGSPRLLSIGPKHLSLRNGEVKVFEQSDVDVGRFEISCEVGRLQVRLETRTWWEWEKPDRAKSWQWEIAAEGTNHISVSIPERSRSGATIWSRCDQDNRILISALADSTCSVKMMSVDREPDIDREVVR